MSTLKRRMTAARSATGAAKRTTMGMPTPTVVLSAGVMFGVSTAEGRTVENVVARCARRPRGPTPSTATRADHVDGHAVLRSQGQRTARLPRLASGAEGARDGVTFVVADRDASED